MRRFLWVLLLAGAAGCAVRPIVPRTVSGSWSTIQALAPGTQLGVYVQERNVRYGSLEVVTERTLTLRERRGLEALARERIERVVVRTPTGASRRGPILQSALIGAAITGGLGLFAKSMEENPRPDGGKWALFITGTAAGAGIGALRAPRETFSERLVYIRP